MGDRGNGAWIGAKFKRKEDHRLTTGRGQYFGDIKVPGALELVFVRSNRAHARIKSIDTVAAKAMPGVVDVITGDDIRHFKSLSQPVLRALVPAHFPDWYMLEIDTVRHYGAPVAAVIARDRYIAEDAAETVLIDYEDLPYVGGAEEALAPGAPTVYGDWDDNLILELDFTGGNTPEEQATNVDQVDQILRASEHMISQRYRVHRCGATPMEPRGCMAKWDTSDGLTLWSTSQRPHIERVALSDLLDLPSSKIRIIPPRDAGGGFGVKAPVYRETVVVAYAAMKLDRPVRWQENRQEHLTCVGQERDQIHYVDVGFDNDGRITALRTRGFADNGDGANGVYHGFVMPMTGAFLFPNTYDVPRADIQIKIAVTNKPALTPARSFGAYPTRFAIERTLDKIAAAVGKDPAEVRLLNFIQETPFTTVTGFYLDSGSIVAVFKDLMAHMDYRGFRAAQVKARAEGRYIGIGFGTGAEFSGIPSVDFVPMENQPGYGAATVRLDPRGHAIVYIGDTTQGQGHETTTAQVVAHEFGIHPDDVTLIRGDTELTPFGSGTVAARSGPYTMNAVAKACRVLKEKIATIVAHDMGLNAGIDDFEFAGGFVTYTRDDNIKQTFREVTERIIMAPINLPPGMEAGLEHTTFFDTDHGLMAFCAHAATVEVNPDTGQFKILRYAACEDVGTIINPLVVEGQIHGGAVMGISNALYEQFVHDENGQMLTADLENYKLITAVEAPTIEIVHSDNGPCPFTPLGTRGVGEGTPGPVPGALANAVTDALSPFGVEVNELPIRPDKLWRMIRDAREATAAR
jgi:carbon-monoxide dehydrogenase large subunit